MERARVSFKINNMGEAKFDSPLGLSKKWGDNVANYVRDEQRVLLHNLVSDCKKIKTEDELFHSFEMAGPRAKLFFDPKEITCAIVSCGGLCPGINNVIRAFVNHLWHGYGVKNILGIKYGFQGLVESFGHVPIKLTPQEVLNIHEFGGSFLSSSRGEQNSSKLVDTLEKYKVNALITIGGDGTFRGADDIYKEIKKRGKKISVIGVPKTIDNDLVYIDKTFGFETAFSEAARAIRSAHVEAMGAPNGIGILKLMGRHSGYVAAYAALAMSEVNLVLIPEQKFTLDAVFKIIEERLKTRSHIVIVVAEGAGQELFNTNTCERDASGNLKLKDIGRFLEEAIKCHFKEKKIDVNLKYIDPSYMIRSAPANPTDSVFTGYLGQYAGDAVLAGKTGCAIGYWKGSFTHLPLTAAISKRNTISLESELWREVLESTGQPITMM